MNKEINEKAVKEIIEYANHEIKKSKKRYLTIFLSILGIVVFLTTAYLFVFKYETPVAYSKDMVEVYIPVDEGLDVKINLPNYKNAQAVLVKIDENAFDLYISVTQTLSTKIFDDSDESNNMLRIGNSIVVDFQSGLLRGHLPNGYSAENIMHIYYIDNLSNKTIVMNDSELMNYENKILVWTRY